MKVIIDGKEYVEKCSEANQKEQDKIVKDTIKTVLEIIDDFKNDYKILMENYKEGGMPIFSVGAEGRYIASVSIYNQIKDSLLYE